MLSVDKAKDFFGSLYENDETPDLNGFEAAAIRLVARIDGVAAPGDKALALLMLNQIMSTPDDQVDPARKGALTAAILMNIKAPAVDGFLEAFPQQSLEELVDAANKAGYQVDVLSPERANDVPRSVLVTGGNVIGRR